MLVGIFYGFKYYFNEIKLNIYVMIFDSIVIFFLYFVIWM